MPSIKSIAITAVIALAVFIIINKVPAIKAKLGG
jgi:hypothetical protein